MLDRLMDDELTEEERGALRAHGETCQACAGKIRAAMQMKALFEEMEPEVDVPLQAQAAWRAAVRREAGQTGQAGLAGQTGKAGKAGLDGRRRWVRWVGSAAAAVVVLAGVGLALSTRNAPRENVNTAQVEMVAAGGAAQEAAYEVGQETADEAAYENAETVVYEAEEAAYDAASEGASRSAVEPIPASTAEPLPEAREAAPSDKGAADVEDSAPRLLPESGMESSAEYAIMAPAPKAAEEAEASALTILETDGESAPMCAAVAQRAPVCELRLRVADVDVACKLISDLAEEYEGVADVQRLEDGGANVYAEVGAENVSDFLSALAPVGEIEGETEIEEQAGGATALILLVIDSR